MKLPRRFPPTQEGWWFLSATLLVGIAAVNGGINLLFLIFGMMLFLILASGVLSEWCLRDLAVHRQPPAKIHAGMPYLMGLSVRNDKRRIPTFSLEVEDLLAGKPVSRRGYFLKLPAGRLQETAYRNTVATRGLHRLTGFRISTRFPFGLIRKSRDIDDAIDLLVYPALSPVPDGLLPVAPAQPGKLSVARPSRAGEFHGLREFRLGDDPRSIHWRTSARRGHPFVRESEDDSTRTAVVSLAAGAETPVAFENAVSLAASVAVALLARGFQVGLETPDEALPPGEGLRQTTRILKILALVKVGKVGLSGVPAAALPADHAGHANITRFRVSAGSPVPRVAVSGHGHDRRQTQRSA